jgi:hypothetical protein
MRRRFAVFAAAAALMLTASPAIAGVPAERSTFDGAGLVFTCGSDTLVTTSGEFSFVTRTATTSSGNWSQTGTLTVRNMVAEDGAENQYRVVGAAHFGFSYNAQTGVVVANVDGNDISQGVTTFKFQFIRADGGAAGSMNFVQHVSPNGQYREFSAGACETVND